MSALEAVAEAIWRATVPAAAEKGLTFSEMAESTHKVFHLMAQAAIDALQVAEETRSLPVFVEDVPRAPIQDMVGMEGRFKQHVEFIPHTRYKSVWFGADCPDCAEELGIHDRRHSEILASAAVMSPTKEQQ